MRLRAAFSIPQKISFARQIKLEATAAGCCWGQSGFLPWAVWPDCFALLSLWRKSQVYLLAFLPLVDLKLLLLSIYLQDYFSSQLKSLLSRVYPFLTCSLFKSHSSWVLIEIIRGSSFPNSPFPRCTLQVHYFHLSSSVDWIAKSAVEDLGFGFSFVIVSLAT